MPYIVQYLDQFQFHHSLVPILLLFNHHSHSTIYHSMTYISLIPILIYQVSFPFLSIKSHSHSFLFPQSYQSFQVFQRLINSVSIFHIITRTPAHKQTLQFPSKTCCSNKTIKLLTIEIDSI